jgi:hypothetical protein
VRSAAVGRIGGGVLTHKAQSALASFGAEVVFAPAIWRRTQLASVCPSAVDSRRLKLTEDVHTYCTKNGPKTRRTMKPRGVGDVHLVPWTSRYLGNNPPILGAIEGSRLSSVSYVGQIHRRTMAFCQIQAFAEPNAGNLPGIVRSFLGY